MTSLAIGPLLKRHPELETLHSRITTFLDRHLPVPLCEADERPDWLALRRHAADAGLIGIDAGPDSHGRLAQGMAMFMAGRRDCDAREVFSTGHAAMALHYGSPNLVRDTQERVIGAGQLAGVASSEPHSGSDLRGFETVLVDHGDHFTLSGSKGLISRIEEACGFVVLCKIVPAPELGRVDLRHVPLSAVWLPMDTPGILTDTAEPLGMKGWSFGHLRFVDVRLDKDLLLAGPVRDVRFSTLTSPPGV